MCDQQRFRPACAYAQSDLSFCHSFAYSRSVQLLTKHHLEFLSLTGGCTGLSESKLVKMPHCWKSHVVAKVKQPTLLILSDMIAQGGGGILIFSCIRRLGSFYISIFFFFLGGGGGSEK